VPARTGAADVAIGTGQLHSAAFADSNTSSAEAPAATSATADSANVHVRLNVNGTTYDLNIDPRTTLLDCVREHLHLTGTRKGCDHGQCGACTVHVDGKRVNWCLSLAATHEGEAITTIDGIGRPGALHSMQAAFVEHDGFQCGYCTSGQIMSAVALLNEPYGHSDDEVKEAMRGNICSCGAHSNIVSAIQQIRRKESRQDRRSQAWCIDTEDLRIRKELVERCPEMSARLQYHDACVSNVDPEHLEEHRLVALVPLADSDHRHTSDLQRGRRPKVEAAAGKLSAPADSFSAVQL
jgi:xanthine dehydrogenase YagT iron-sulfur-binding subunit